MVCAGVLIGLSLISLLSSGEAVDVDVTTLAQIIQFFEANYKPPGTDLIPNVQYAVAINVPAGQCGASFSQNFLSGEDPAKVREDLQSKRRLYVGERLVAATPKDNGRKAVHSERTLLMCEESQAVAPVQNLLNKDNEGCVVFFTYNSPCLKYCLNQQREICNKADITPAVKKCILNSLQMLTNHGGPKAFVFSEVYRQDTKDEDREKLAAALKKVAELVPLYKCNAGSCVKCLNSGEINNQCLS